MTFAPLLQLIRFDKPIGTLLLWYPTAWALWLANHAQPNWRIVALLFLGTFLMRSAGCVFNDITDRQFDQHVQRTAQRPITSGKISLINAFLVLGGLLVAASTLLILLPPACFQYALLALLITGIYPFAKRWLPAPQLILGIAFSLGIPMAYAASGQPLDSNTGLLLTLNFFWIIAYDTIYALSDRADDQRIGIHSTALLFGKQVFTVILICYLISHSLWLLIAWLNHLSGWFYSCWCLSTGVLVYQMITSNPQTNFKSNGLYGLLLWIALMH